MNDADKMTNDEILEAIKSLRQTIEDREQDKVDEIPQGVLDMLSKKLSKFKELCDGVNEVVAIDVVVKEYPVFVEFCTSDGFYVTDEIESLDNHVGKGFDLCDFLEKNTEVQTALEAKNEEFARFSKEVEAVATEHECEVHRVWNIIDTNSVFHD